MLQSCITLLFTYTFVTLTEAGIFSKEIDQHAQTLTDIVDERDSFSGRHCAQLCEIDNCVSANYDENTKVCTMMQATIGCSTDNIGTTALLGNKGIVS